MKKANMKNGIVTVTEEPIKVEVTPVEEIEIVEEPVVAPEPVAAVMPEPEPVVVPEPVVEVDPVPSKPKAAPKPTIDHDLPTKVPMSVMFKELSDEEGLKLKPYYDTVGILTVGIGHNMQANPVQPIIGRRIGIGQRITMEEAEKLFAYDIEKTVRELDKRIPWFDKLSVARQYVLISMAFNLGIGGLLEFKNTLARLEDGDIAGTIRGMERSLWARQVKRRAVKLVRIMREDKI